MLRKRTKSTPGRRRAAVAVMVAVSMIGLMAVVAVALDGGILLEDRRRAQGTADAAALAAVSELFLRYPTEDGKDFSGKARDGALAVALANGFPNDDKRGTVTVNIPPKTGPFTDKWGYAEVIVRYNQKRFFSTVYGEGTMPVTARAVAGGQWSQIDNGIIVLDRDAKGALNAHGKGTIRVTNAPILVNSADDEAAIANGGRAKIEAPVFDIVGDYATKGGAQFVGTLNTGTRAVADPLRFLPVPDLSTMHPGTITTVSTTASTTTTSTSGGKKSDSVSTNGGGGEKSYSLTPGRFSGGLKFSGKESVTMAPGIYYMDEGGFSFSGQGSLTGNGVMIYNAPSKKSDSISITGQGTVNLTPPTSGPYAGLLFFQDRTADVDVKVSGNGQFKIAGGFYAANAACKVEGNGDQSIGSQFISRTLDVGGNGDFNVTWDATRVPRTRVIQLVE